MARQPYFVDTQTKQMEVFSDFSGGLVTFEHPSKLNDNEYQQMENVDIIAGGAVTQRGAYKRISDGTSAGLGSGSNIFSQGLFNYENLTGGLTLEAFNGKLYKVISGTYTQISITNLATFQTTRPIEAVQIGTKMYIATGSGLVTFDGTTAALLTPYTPNADEAIYTGLNALATDPESYVKNLSDGTITADQIMGIKIYDGGTTNGIRYGLTNKYTDFNAFLQFIVGHSLDFRWSTKLTTDAKFVVSQDWSSSSTFHHKFTKKADYSIKCEIRLHNTTAILDDYTLGKFRVLSSPDPKPAPTINGADLNTCNRILFHYNRLWLYGDTGNPNNLYVSQLNNYAYFPRPNTTPINDPQRGILQNITQYRGTALAFTNHGIKMIEGEAPTDFVITPIHTNIGTLSPYSVQVIGNAVAFVGNDNRIYNLLPTYRTLSAAVMNVQPIDNKIRDGFLGSSVGGTSFLISQSNKILSCVYNNQYYLYLGGIGGANYIYRYHYETGVWTRDNVAQPMSQIEVFYNTLLTSSDVNGRIYQLSRGVYFDDVNTNFNVTIMTKDFDYGMPYHKKKLKQVQLIAKTTSNVVINLALYGDDVLMNPNNRMITSDPTKNFMDSQKFILSASGRFRYIRGIIQFAVTNDVTLLGLGFVFKQSSPK